MAFIYNLKLFNSMLFILFVEFILYCYYIELIIDNTFVKSVKIIRASDSRFYLGFLRYRFISIWKIEIQTEHTFAREKSAHF